ncbi:MULTISPECIES: ClpXP protease specificity-enhancing factor [Eikenella]|uniref:ClpXP protease specificity-enhancing factor n=1 Tax=Eikenella longinqua TaxID=1795827 RepID=A0A1A9RXE8_9NEIS|nr:MULTISPECIES: ClpXP protease specificity-enhancing factor [Eikenella]OAM29411.1 ClpXP protease specificity-enhancing factor [Eikenella longinqua]
MNSTFKPYLLRALYEWCNDRGHAPYIQVWVNEHTRVPMQFVKDEHIILNISHTACAGLTIDNDWISFSARFGGVAQEIWVPVGHVASMYARESGEGMSFEVIPYQPDTPPESGADSGDKPAAKRKGLKLVK